MDEVHGTIVEAIAKELHGEAMSTFINRTIQQLDEIAGRYETGPAWSKRRRSFPLMTI